MRLGSQTEFCPEGLRKRETHPQQQPITEPFRKQARGREIAHTIATRQQQQQRCAVDAPDASGKTGDAPRFKQQVMGRGDGVPQQQRGPSSIVVALLVNATPVVAATSRSVSNEVVRNWNWNGSAWPVCNSREAMWLSFAAPRPWRFGLAESLSVVSRIRRPG
jgi:hypothetical protein